MILEIPPIHAFNAKPAILPRIKTFANQESFQVIFPTATL